MQPGDDDDDPDLFPCYRHASELTALHCISCERPICVDCAVQGAVGIKCPDCARTSRAARGAVPVARFARGAAAGAAVALVLGSLLALAQIAFFGIILAYVVGIATGEVTRRASGGYRDPHLSRAAATSAAVGILALPALAMLSAEAVDVRYLVYSLVGAAAAAYAVYTRSA